MMYSVERCPNCDCVLPQSEGEPAHCCPYCDALLDLSASISRDPSFPPAGQDPAAGSVPSAFETSGKTLVSFSGEDRIITVPNGIRTIGSGAFLGRDRIRAIELPDDVLDIGPCAFKGCTSLKTIRLSFRLKAIGEYAFQDCRSLESIHLPINVETIGNGAFFGCEALNVINCDREDPLPPEAFGDSELEECFTFTTINELQPCSCGCGELLPVRRYERFAAQIPALQSQRRWASRTGNADPSFVKIKLKK